MSKLVQISAGNGPQEVARFVALLGQRLIRRCAELGISVTGQSFHGPASAPRSITLCVEGPAIDRLRREEEGTHALVARSELRARRARKRWFAAVNFLDPPQPSAAALRQEELELSACRASGAGGQNVNKRSTAVRLRHLPSGISVRVDAQRRQADNRRLAEERIADLLRRREGQIAAETTAEMRGNHWRLVRGRPVRTYRIDREGNLQEIACAASFAIASVTLR